MADREGNVLYPPGLTVKAAVAETEIMASMAAYTQKGRTIKTGQGTIAAGTIMSRESATKKWIKYTNAGTAGAEVAKGFLRNSVDTASQDKLGNIVFAGILKLSVVLAANGYADTTDAAFVAAVADLNARFDVNLDWLIF